MDSTGIFGVISFPNRGQRGRQPKKSEKAWSSWFFQYAKSRQIMNMNIVQVVCILVYDQVCMESCGRGGECVIAIDWFDTILNHALVVANAVAALHTMRAIRKARGVTRPQGFSGSIPPYLALPSHLASCSCFVFGKFLFACVAMYAMLSSRIIMNLSNHFGSIINMMHTSRCIPNTSLPGAKMQWRLHRMVCDDVMVNHPAYEIIYNFAP